MSQNGLFSKNGEPDGDDEPDFVPGDTAYGTIDRHRTDHEAERLLLSILMHGGGMDSTLVSDLDAGMFAKYDDLAKVMLRLLRNGVEPDLETLHSEAVDVPNEVVDARPPVMNADYFANRIQKAYLSRDYGERFADLARRAWEGDDPDVLVEDLETLAIDLSRRTSQIPIRPVGYYVDDVVEEVEASEGETVTGLETGIPPLDEVTKGWQPSDLIYLAGRPSMGKTSLALQTLRHNAKRGVPGAMVSSEMTPLRLVTRMLFQEANLASKKDSYTSSEWQRIRTAADTVKNLPVYVTEQTGLDIHALSGLFRRMVLEHDCGLLSFDYFQLLQQPSDHRGNKQDYLATASQKLKAMAKDFNVPMLVLSQLNREVEHRGGMQRPQLSDLRATGSMEQDADMVVFIHRPEKYGIDVDERGNPTNGIAELIVGKNRNGPIGMASVTFREHTTRFDTLSDRDRQSTRIKDQDEEAPF